MTPEHATGWMAFVSALAHSPDAVLLIVVMFCGGLMWIVLRLYKEHKACTKQIGQLNDAVTVLYAILRTDSRFRGWLPSLGEIKAGRVDMDQVMSATSVPPPNLNQKLGDE